MKKLKVGIISPSNNFLGVFPKRTSVGIENTKKIGMDLVFSENAFRKNNYTEVSVRERIKEINDFLDSDIDMLLASIGGHTSIQVLDKIDYSKICKKHILICGFSDITALLIAAHVKTGAEMLYGPVYTVNLCDYGGIDEYTKNSLLDCISGKEITYEPSRYSINEYIDWGELEKKEIIKKRKKKQNDWIVINSGMAKGKLIGGNLKTLLLLLGTKYLPIKELDNKILFLEDCNTNILEFCSHLESLRLKGVFKRVNGIVFGKFDTDSMNNEIKQFLMDYMKKYNIPVICNVDFGHVFPILTLPIGREAVLKCNQTEIKFKISKRK